MLRIRHTRGLRSAALAGMSLIAATFPACGQTAATPSVANAPASIPAGLLPNAPTTKSISEKQAREADDAYLEGAKHISQKDLVSAEHSFVRAVQLDPTNQNYLQALAVTRDHRATELIQNSARARQNGDLARADQLLAEAAKLAPDSPIVTQHLNGLKPTIATPQDIDHTGIAQTLAGPIEFEPNPGKQSFHTRGGPQELARTVYKAFGIATSFDSSVDNGSSIKFDIDDVDFANATRILTAMTHTFAVPLQAKSALVAKDTEENRERLVPQIEETIYLPGVTQEAMSELGNIARNVFDLKQVTASASAGKLLLRGDEPTLRLVNATYADMLDGGSEVLLDINLYEVDRDYMRNVGATLPSSAGAFSIAAEATSLISANQSIINAAITSGALKLTGNPIQDLILEIGVLIASGTVGASQFSNFLGTFGGGLAYAGLYLGSSSTFNLLLTSSEVHTLDSITLRDSDKVPISFRAGTRYPVVTATYSSGASTSTSTASLAALAAQYGIPASQVAAYLKSASTSSIPQFQFEDLGLTLKATPHVLHTGSVALQLEMKLEALGGSSLNSIPILNSRALTSTVTVPAGQTALLVSEVSASEIHSIDGIPGLSELPGFEGTEKSLEKDSSELVITITPHIVRSGSLHIASRILSTGPMRGGSQ